MIRENELPHDRATEVVVLAPAAYVNLAAQVWLHALLPHDDTRGIGDQMVRLAALANRRPTAPTGTGTHLPTAAHRRASPNCPRRDRHPGRRPTSAERACSKRGGRARQRWSAGSPTYPERVTCAAEGPCGPWRLAVPSHHPQLRWDPTCGAAASGSVGS